MGLLNNYREFQEKADAIHLKNSNIKYIQYMFLRLHYGLPVFQYFEHEFYDGSKKIDKDICERSHLYIHKWKVAKKSFCPNRSSWWNFTHYIDFCFSKLFYPGLDALDYFRYEFYNFKASKRKTFITEKYLVKMDRFFNDSPEGRRLDDLISNKVDFNRMFNDLIHRKWISTYNCSLEEFDEFIADLDRVIIKPLDMGGGIGISVKDVSLQESKHELYEEVRLKHCIMEEIIKEHPAISHIHPSSVNTIRVNSVSTENEIFITGACLRIGVNNSHTDNYSSGGIAAEVDVKTGIVISPAVSQYGEKCYVHPTTGARIIGLEIPHWDSILTTVKSAHERIRALRYIGWDVVVDANDNVLLIEANTCAGVELQQHPSLTGKKPIYDEIMKGI